MRYPLKNGTSVTIRKPTAQDAQAIVSIISTADAETLFLARNPGEFCTTVEREEAIIEGVLADEDSTWFVAEYEGRLVGQCSVGLVRRYQRYRYRVEVAFVVLKEYQGLGIGGKMMEECIALYGRNLCGRIKNDKTVADKQSLYKDVSMNQNINFRRIFACRYKHLPKRQSMR